MRRCEWRSGRVSIQVCASCRQLALHKTLGLGRVRVVQIAPYKVLAERTKNPFTSRRPPYAIILNRRCLVTVSCAWILLDPMLCPSPGDGDQTGCAKKHTRMRLVPTGDQAAAPSGVCNACRLNIRPIVWPNRGCNAQRVYKLGKPDDVLWSSAKHRPSFPIRKTRDFAG